MSEPQLQVLLESLERAAEDALNSRRINNINKYCSKCSAKIPANIKKSAQSKIRSKSDKNGLLRPTHSYRQSSPGHKARKTLRKDASPIHVSSNEIYKDNSKLSNYKSTQSQKSKSNNKRDQRITCPQEFSNSSCDKVSNKVSNKKKKKSRFATLVSQITTFIHPRWKISKKRKNNENENRMQQIQPKKYSAKGCLRIKKNCINMSLKSNSKRRTNNGELKGKVNKKDILSSKASKRSVILNSQENNTSKYKNNPDYILENIDNSQESDSVSTYRKLIKQKSSSNPEVNYVNTLSKALYDQVITISSNVFKNTFTNVNLAKSSSLPVSTHPSLMKADRAMLCHSTKVRKTSNVGNTLSTEDCNKDMYKSYSSISGYQDGAIIVDSHSKSAGVKCKSETTNNNKKYAGSADPFTTSDPQCRVQHTSRHSAQEKTILVSPQKCISNDDANEIYYDPPELVLNV